MVVVSLVFFVIDIFLFFCFYFVKKEKKKLEENYNDLKHAKIEIENENKVLVEEKENFRVENIVNKEKIKNLEEKIEKESENFKNIASNILEKNQEKLLIGNQNSLNIIVAPLREEIEKLKKQILDTHLENEKSRTSLKDSIRQMQDSSESLKKEANNLVDAINGNKKLQGIWGEMQLENILAMSGLKNKIDYEIQKTFIDGSDGKKIPDCVINIPGNKQIIIDSKVTLNSYQKYFNAKNNEEKENYLKSYIENIQRHIANLSSKEYYKIEKLETIDFVIMFIPIDYAFSIILENDVKIFDYAFKNNIVMASPSTLIALCKTISFLWKEDTLNKSREEIVKIAEKMYNKFYLFIEDMKCIGKYLDNCQDKYNSAMNKLTQSSKKGETLVGLADNLKKLGISSKESISLQEKLVSEYMNENIKN